MKIVIVGGVAGGATAAARARRLAEDAEILIIERGPYISFANCGLPYFVGGEIRDREALLVASPGFFRARYNVEVHVEHEAVSIDPVAKTIQVRNSRTAETYAERFDKLLLSPGAVPIRPPIPGIETEDVFVLRAIPEMDAIVTKIRSGARRALVVGAGYIGLEMAEALVRQGLEVSVVEVEDQVTPFLDHEMAALVAEHLREKRVRLYLGQRVRRLTRQDGEILAETGKEGAGGETLRADAVLLSAGVRPETTLARSAGLEIGERGGIVVDEYLRTSHSDIYAVGDAVEVTHLVSGQKTLVPLAGPATKQARIAAANMLGRAVRYRGTPGTGIVKVFDLTVGSTGLTEKACHRFGMRSEAVVVHPLNHAGYYPGAQTMALKLVFDPVDGRVLGAQAVGGQGVDKRIDVIATAIHGGMTVTDLEELDLAYAPPYGSAKDPVNIAGFVAGNVLRGDHEIIHWDEIEGLDPDRYRLLDVRTRTENAAGTIPGSLLIPVDELRGRLGELPRGRTIVVFCRVGLRAYVASRILEGHGFRTVNLTGGYRTYSVARG